MKLIPFFTVALFVAACSGDVDRQTARDQAAPKSDRAAEPVATTGKEPDAAALRDFKARVEDYMDIHKDAAKGPAKLKETKDPAKIQSAQDTLAARIRTARANAKHGDIFTPEISTSFRRLLAPEMKGEDGRDAKAVMKDDAPAPATVSFKVNARYPEGQPLPTVPANVLINLPRIPEPLEYRIIGRHLLLLDSDANLIVDYLPNAIK